MKNVKISIVVPVYNTQEYLEQCINSVLNQTLEEIEMICVDDGSKDDSYAIMQRFAKKDKRLKCIRFETSKSALQARKVGVMTAEGEYIMFLDADDYLEPEACEKLYQKMKEVDVDILHFSSRVVNCANLPEKRIANNQKLLTPFEGRIEGPAVFEDCFIHKKYFITLWNKVFRAELCKKAFEHMEDKYLPKAQDLYSFFIIAYFAQSYFGWNGDCLHNYCLGRGVVGSSSMNLDKFERYCTQVNVAKAMRIFSEKQNTLDKTEVVINRYYTQWIKECLQLWKQELPVAYAAEGWDILCKYWGIEEVLAYVAKMFWTQRPDLARRLNKLPHLTLKDREIKTIGIYYYHFTIGGVQRVMSLLSTMFLKMGYKVVIITDSETTEKDFPLPEGVIRTNVFHREQVKENNIQDRIQSWKSLIQEYQFDMLFYHAWTSNMMLWDFLYFKNMNIPVIVHAHSVFSFAVNKFQNLFVEITKVLPIADGMVVLSEADKAFWDAYNDKVYSIPNPISDDLKGQESAKWENKSVIWVGRVSNEKQPHAIFTIMEKVVRQVPDAKLYLAGDFDAPEWQELAVSKGLQDNVIFCGMIQNVNDYYKKASVYVSTSKYEGFPMTLLEAQAHALPTVMFRMPHLTLGTPECGVVGVDMMDCTSAADEIVKLLTKQEHWAFNSNLAKQSYESLEGYDFETAWQEVLDGKDSPRMLTKPVENMIHTFVNHYEEGFKFQAKEKPKTIVSDPVSYKIGRIITFIPRKIVGGIQCVKDHGFVYTVKYAFAKVAGKKA